MNQDELLELAGEKFGTLSQAEEKLFEAVANGEVADYSAESDEENDPADAKNWAEERVLKADRIAWLCTNRDVLALVTHRGISVQGARIEDELNLAFAGIPFPLFFKKCAFTEALILHDAEIRGLNLMGTHTG